MDKGTVVCCMTDDSDYSVDFVKQWCKDHGYSGETVKIVKREVTGVRMVVAEVK